MQIIAKILIGEALDGKAGAIVVRHEDSGRYTVHIDGGTLPNGNGEERFANVFLAISYAADIAKQYALEAAF